MTGTPDSLLDPVLDHLVWAAASLHEGTEVLSAATGVAPAPGGSHAGLGTHNALAGLGSGSYLELIAPDPGQAGGLLAGAVGIPPRPELIAWAVRVEDAAAVVSRAGDLGLPARLVPMSRRTTAGDLLQWEIAVVGGHGYGGAMPFFIDWLGTPHPAERLPADLALEDFGIAVPQPGALVGLLRAFGVDAGVRNADAPALHARLAGPGGTLEISGPARGLMDPFL
jgi:hypothetical protein